MLTNVMYLVAALLVLVVVASVTTSFVLRARKNALLCKLQTIMALESELNALSKLLLTAEVRSRLPEAPAAASLELADASVYHDKAMEEHVKGNLPAAQEALDTCRTYYGRTMDILDGRTPRSLTAAATAGPAPKDMSNQELQPELHPALRSKPLYKDFLFMSRVFCCGIWSLIVMMNLAMDTPVWVVSAGVVVLYGYLAVARANTLKA